MDRSFVWAEDRLWEWIGAAARRSNGQQIGDEVSRHIHIGRYV